MDPFARPDFEVAVGSPRWEDAAAESLRRGGLCVLRGAAADGGLLGRCSDAALERLQRLLPLVGARGLDAERDSVMFRELCKRMHHQRFDVRLPLPEGSAGADPLPGASALPAAQSAAWAELHARAQERAVPVLRRVLGDCGGSGVDTAGCVVSLPGSGDQNFHQDGSLEGFFNIFVPLVDVTAENGPTQFLPGSHRPACGALSFGEADAEPLAPALALGDILIFDYRVRHRGLGNRSAAARPVAYLVYARAGLSDVHNFPPESLLLSGVAAPPAGTPGAERPDGAKPPDVDGAEPPDADGAEPPDADGAEPPDAAGGAEATPTAPSRPAAVGSEAEAREFCPPARAGGGGGPSWWHRLPLDSSARELLGVDGDPEDTEYREVRGACFAAARPVPLTAPRIVLWRGAAAELLGAPPGAAAPPADELCGNRLPAQELPFTEAGKEESVASITMSTGSMHDIDEIYAMKEILCFDVRLSNSTRADSPRDSEEAAATGERPDRSAEQG